MAVFRVHKTNNYTLIDNNIFRNKNLSSKAIGLLCVMLSLPDDWDYSVEGLTQIRKESKNTINSILRELEVNKYLIRTKVKNDKGVFITCTYDIYEQPYLKNPDMENPYLKKPYMENCNQLNTNILNTNKSNTNKRFIKPTIDEISKYCDERHNGINANAFYDFYESKNWMIGKNKMKDWRACVRTWEQRQNKKPKIIPKWFNQNIQDQGLVSEKDEDFEDFIKEFRNEEKSK